MIMIQVENHSPSPSIYVNFLGRWPCLSWLFSKCFCWSAVATLISGCAGFFSSSLGSTTIGFGCMSGIPVTTVALRSSAFGSISFGMQSGISKY